MDTKQKNELIAQIVEAMDLSSTDDKVELLKDLINKWGLNYSFDIRMEQPAQKKTPNGFKMVSASKCDILPYAKYNEKAIGVVFCLGGKHFIFSSKNAENQITLRFAKENLKKGVYGKIDGNPWVIPTIEMFQEVASQLKTFNLTMEVLGAEKVGTKRYLDASMNNPNQVGILRLAMWAPWLD